MTSADRRRTAAAATKALLLARRTPLLPLHTVAAAAGTSNRAVRARIKKLPARGVCAAAAAAAYHARSDGWACGIAVRHRALPTAVLRLAAWDVGAGGYKEASQRRSTAAWFARWDPARSDAPPSQTRKAANPNRPEALRAKAAANPNRPEALRIRLMGDPAPEVRRRAAGTPPAPPLTS